MYGGIDVLFNAVISVLSLSFQIGKFGLYVTFITGEALFNIFVFFITKSVSFVKSLFICAQIMYEDLFYFLNDIRFSLSSLFILLTNIFDYFQFLSICLINHIFSVTVKITDSINVIYFIWLSIFHQCLKLLELFKDSLLLIGSSVWLTFTYAIPIGFLHILEIVCNLGTQCLDKLYSFTYSSLEYFKLTFIENTFPYESIFGLVIATVLLYGITKHFPNIIKFSVSFTQTFIKPLFSSIKNFSLQLWNMYFGNLSDQRLFQNFFNFNFIASRLQRTVNILTNNHPPIKSRCIMDTSNKVKDPSDFDDVCIICLDKKRDVILLPCRHFCMCLHCSDRFSYDNDKCPMCRQSITEILQVYY